MTNPYYNKFPVHAEGNAPHLWVPLFTVCNHVLCECEGGGTSGLLNTSTTSSVEISLKINHSLQPEQKNHPDLHLKCKVCRNPKFQWCEMSPKASSDLKTSLSNVTVHRLLVLNKDCRTPSGFLPQEDKCWKHGSPCWHHLHLRRAVRAQSTEQMHSWYNQRSWKRLFHQYPQLLIHASSIIYWTYTTRLLKAPLGLHPIFGSPLLTLRYQMRTLPVSSLHPHQMQQGKWGRASCSASLLQKSQRKG